MVNGCAYGRENRVMIKSIKEDIGELKENIKDNFIGVNDNIKDLFNHQSSRLPRWVTVVGTIGGTLIGGLVTLCISLLIKLL